MLDRMGRWAALVHFAVAGLLAWSLVASLLDPAEAIGADMDQYDVVDFRGRAGGNVLAGLGVVVFGMFGVRRLTEKDYSEI